MSAPATVRVPECPTCGQPLPPPEVCSCGHGIAVHNLSTDSKRRTNCSTWTAQVGQCGCRKYEPAEVPGA